MSSYGLNDTKIATAGGDVGQVGSFSTTNSATNQSPQSTINRKDVIVPIDDHNDSFMVHKSSPNKSKESNENKKSAFTSNGDFSKRNRAYNFPFIPLLSWIKSYSREEFKFDFIAGLIVAIMLIPQGMAYATLAGVPPQYGLYSAFIPPIIYAFFGTSKELSIGPVAIVSLMVSSGLSKYQESLSVVELIEVTILLTFLVGLSQLILGLCQAGNIVKYFSHPMLKGVIFAASIMIATSQLPKLIGLDHLQSHEYAWQTIFDVFQHYAEINIFTVCLSLESILLLMIMKYLKKTKKYDGFKWIKPFKAIPGTLVVAVINTIAVWGFNLNTKLNISIVGPIESRLPLPSASFLGKLDVYVIELLPTAIVIAFVAFMESVAIAKTFATKKGYVIDPNQELVALGMSNLLGSLTQSIPTTGSLSRSIINNDNGCRTPFSNIITASLVTLAITTLTPAIQWMPLYALASIVAIACLNLFDSKNPKFLWNVKRYDFWVWFISVLATLIRGIELGVICGTIASILRVIYETSNPSWCRLGQLKETEIGNQVSYRNIERFPEGIEAFIVPGVEILRFDSMLYFANTSIFEEMVRSFAASQHVKNIILDFSMISSFDASAVICLRQLYLELRRKKSNIQLYIVSIRGPVRDILENTGLTDLLNSKGLRIFNEIHNAVCFIHYHNQNGSESLSDESIDPISTSTSISMPTRTEPTRLLRSINTSGASIPSTNDAYDNKLCYVFNQNNGKIIHSVLPKSSAKRYSSCVSEQDTDYCTKSRSQSLSVNNKPVPHTFDYVNSAYVEEEVIDTNNSDTDS